MNKRMSFATRVALLAVLLLSAHTTAYGQKALIRPNSLLPDVQLGLNRLGVDVSSVNPAVAPKPILPVLPSVSVPDIAVRVAPPIVPGTAVSVNVNTGGSAPLLAVGVDVSGSTLGVSVGDGGIPGAPPAPNFPASGLTPAAQEQLLQQRLALLPTCR